MVGEARSVTISVGEPAKEGGHCQVGASISSYSSHYTGFCLLLLIPHQVKQTGTVNFSH